MSQQHEGQAIAVIGVVLDPSIIQRPGVALVIGLEMHLLEEVQRVARALQVLRALEVLSIAGISEDVAGAGHQMTVAPIVDLAIVAQIVEETALGIDGPRVIKRHGLANMSFERRDIVDVHERVLESDEPPNLTDRANRAMFPNAAKYCLGPGAGCSG